MSCRRLWSICGFRWYKKYNVYDYLNNENVYITPNMTYKPRVCKKPLGTIVNGSVAILIPKSDIKLTEEDMLFFLLKNIENFIKLLEIIKLVL